jgi:hypothetical protein
MDTATRPASVGEYLSALKHDGRPRLDKPIGRRGLFALALAGTALGVAACGGLTQPVPATGGPALPPATGIEATIADKIKLVADAIGNILPALGLTSERLAQGVKVVSDIAGVAGKIMALGGGGVGSLASLASEAAGMIGGLGPLLGIVGGPYGMILTAAAALVPEILRLAGVQGREVPGLARVAMSPDQAERILRTAARRPVS